ncbi:MAG TPA: proton-conducting transporter membrane subunit [Hyphomonadaceae bacterium]|jgi:multicomponent Na+:H+ antiporter subunit D|nr:proton-conducting transporter membrane subunit [Hyphomonadaceae bacterium]
MTGSGELLIMLALIVPLFAAVAIYAVGRMPDVRETLTIVTCIGLSIITITMFVRTGAGDPPSWVLARPMAGLEIAFRIEPLGALFALMASVLWGINSLFSIGYMRGRREGNQTRFYVCFALAMFAVMGIAMAANLFTLFIFYEILTFATYPLVVHAGDAKARKAGRIYLATLVGASLVLFLPGIIGVQIVAGSTMFTQGGLLFGKVDMAAGNTLLLLLVFGAAKAALMPLHGWLPRAMVAPAPVSAMLHAVAVVKAGVFVVLKTSAYIFGPDLISVLPAAGWLLWVAAGTIVIASVIAMTKDDLKSRLAWSTVGQLAYITSAALLPAGAGLVAGGLHMLVHAFAKITLFFCAGAIYVATGASKVSEMRAMGRAMPIVFTCFFIGALCVVGLPPFGGAWSKFLLITAAFGTLEWATAAAMIVSSLLGLLYLVPVAVRGLLPVQGEVASRGFIRPGGAPGSSVAALMVTAGMCLALFLLADEIVRYLAPIAERAP